jgi:hypothetical protein
MTDDFADKQTAASTAEWRTQRRFAIRVAGPARLRSLS